ncbi:DUF4446 family protein [Nocardiopsis kunsanensis]|uniref:DUF4446 family protein n=1 Tax=Nocardiopsis kunsanensis TaxID=141693 RepID=A0A918XHA7_9ACTN|nr:DUF4446 family protein [Nocardiopsis kunsanensis]GHD31993.1 hypothetical protein GCM10007147_35160 [Nocardiopsis kunsanensis]
MVVFLVFLSLVTALAASVFVALVSVRVRALEGENRALLNRGLEVRSSGIDPRAVRDVGVVHYDALEERSGSHSFSLALLDSRGDGIVLTCINGHTQARTYAKAVLAGRARIRLSPEEDRALRSARLGYGPAGNTGRAARTERPGQDAGGRDAGPVTVLSHADRSAGGGHRTGEGE